jgi:hypothetical protein
MAAASRVWIASSFLFLAMGIGKVEAQTPASSGGNDSPPLDGPTIELEPIPSGAPRGTTDQPVRGPKDQTRDRRVYAPKEPPAPIAERPVGARPGRRAQWVPGYWEWDPAESGYVWVGGSWQVPPIGSSWVNTRWARDSDGWYRVPGFWTRRRDRALVATEFATTEPAWRTAGPPADHPDDTPGPAPGPNYFFVPGHYVPAGDRLSWTPGFWARIQPGWDWVPARWVRRPDGWQYREGSWVLDPGMAGSTISRRTTARPNRSISPPPPIEPGPPGTDLGGGAGVDRLSPPLGARPDRDPMIDPDEAEPGAIERGDPPVVIVGPRIGMPFYVIRPPGSYPYGPGGVVVPGAVPPFVRRLLDRVLP